jgi:hypothetical protein
MKSIRQLQTDFNNAANAYKKLDAQLPRIIGIEAVKVVRLNISDVHGYDSGNGVEKWQDRSPVTNMIYDKRQGVKGSTYNSGNPLLFQTHKLFNSIDHKESGKIVEVGVNLNEVSYAQKLNEGDQTKHLPKRKFIPANGEPPNKKILTAVKRKYEYERDKAFKAFKK